MITKKPSPKNPGTEDSPEPKFRNVAKIENLNQLTDVALRFGLDLAVPQADRVVRAAQNLARSAHYMVAAGVDLLSLQAECQHGEFIALLDERGFGKDAAYRAMSYAQFILSRPAKERDQLLSVHKSKVLTLAQADPEVIEELVGEESGIEEVKDLSVRALRQRIRELEAKKVDLATRNESLNEEKDHLASQLRDLRESRVNTTDPVPAVVRDIRLECAELQKKALLSVESIGQLVTEHLDSRSIEIADWDTPIARHLYAALLSLHATAGGLLSQLRESHGAAIDGDGERTALDNFGPDEVKRCAQVYRDLIREHDHEKELREWEREQALPRGKGRPKKKPAKS